MQARGKLSVRPVDHFMCPPSRADTYMYACSSDGAGSESVSPDIGIKGQVRTKQNQDSNVPYKQEMTLADGVSEIAVSLQVQT